MGSWFSKPKKRETRVTAQDRAVLQLKQQRDKLKQYQKKIEKGLDKDRLFAKQLLHDGKKEKAKLLLRKKRFMEQMLIKTDGQLNNLEQMTHNLEFAQMEVEVIAGLKVGNESLQKIHQMLSLDEIERVMEETQEGIEKQREIDELLSGQLTSADEESVLSELEEIIREDEQLNAKEPTEIETGEELALPDVPTDEPIKERKEKARAKPEKQMVAAS